MVGRVISIGLIGLLLVVMLVFAGAALLTGGRPSQPGIGPPGIASVDESRSGVRFAGETRKWSIAGRYVGGVPGPFEIDLRIADKDGQAPPDDLKVEVVLTMVSMPMAPTMARVVRTGPGTYTAVGEVSMSGRWRASVGVPDGTLQVPFEVGP